MRALTGGIPRGCRDGRTREALAYKAYCLAFASQCGWASIPAVARPLLREAGRIAAVELPRLGFALDAARNQRDRNRAHRQQRILRSQLLSLEQRLEQLAKLGPAGRARTPAELLRDRLKGQAS